MHDESRFERLAPARGVAALRSRFALRSWLGAAAIGFAFCTCFASSTASAQVATGHGESASTTNGQRVLRLSYSAPASCPDAARFMNIVRGKTQLVSWSDDMRNAAVRVVLETGGTRGRVEMHGTDAEALERTVDASNCSDLVDALAFVLVIAVDPSVARRAEDGQSEPRTAPSGAKPSGAPAKPPTPPARRPLKARRIQQQIWSLNLGSALETGLTGDAALGVELGAATWLLGDHALETRALRGIATPVTLAPEVGLQLGWLRGASNRDGVELTLNRFAVRGFGCPFFVGLGPHVLLSPCLDVQGGRLVTATEGLLQADSKNLPWWTVGGRAALSARWPSFWLGLSAGAEVNLRPHRFSFREGPDSDTTLFARTPRWSGIVALTLSVPIVRSEL